MSNLNALPRHSLWQESSTYSTLHFFFFFLVSITRARQHKERSERDQQWILFSLWGMATLAVSLRWTISTPCSFCQKPKGTFGMLTKKSMSSLPKHQQCSMPLCHITYGISRCGKCLEKGLRTIFELLEVQSWNSVDLKVWDRCLQRRDSHTLKWVKW